MYIKKIIFFSFFFVLCYLLFAHSALAAFRYPIPELGNCRDNKECLLYCQIPDYAPACWSLQRYGPANKVLGETTIDSEQIAREKGIIFPVDELGNCNSIVKCREFCREAANREICTDFSVKKKLVKKRIKKISSTVLTAARKELGCNNTTSCHNYCRQPENKDLCQSFGEKHALIKKKASIPVISGTVTLGPGGCKTERECYEYCRSHTKECPFFPKNTSSFSSILK